MNPAIIGSRVFFQLQAYDFKLRAKPGGVFFQLQAYDFKLRAKPGSSRCEAPLFKLTSAKRAFFQLL
ncbi:hypothetical protein [Halomonas organivorans]|uniref:hypothetical protein n=1 Tax=Halomonas organivorans TaxID=257772 RepID=UPI0036257574